MHRHGKKHEKGQSLVEFALSLPILILILSGMIDIGRAYFAYIYLEEAAAEAALYTSLNPNCVVVDASNPDCNDPNNAQWRAENSGSTQGIVARDFIAVCLADSSGVCTAYSPGLSDTVYIKATVPFPFITPGISAMAEGITGSDVLTLTVIASHVVITD